MLGYYLSLARRSFKKNVALTVLMVLAIGFGVGASMTTLTVLRMLSADPMPGHSHDLYYVQLDPLEARTIDPADTEPPTQLTRYDSEALLRDHKADHQAMMSGGAAAIDPQKPGMSPFYADARWTSNEIFAMFRIPFLSGGAWSAEDDASAAHVVVLAKPLAEKLFGSTDVVGKTVQIAATPFRVVGVIDNWVPTPHFYDLNTGDYGQQELAFVPFSTSLALKLGRNGNMNCWKEHPDATALDAPCEWIQYWVELDSPAKAAAYKDYLVAYSQQQKKAGRFEREPNVRLRDAIEWLQFNEVVPNDARLQTWVALGFLAVCLINTIGLLLTKFLRRSPEIGVRRALGASKRSIFTQLLIEAGMIGVAGGLLGLLLAWLGLWAVHHQPTSYAQLAHLDMPMLAGTLALAIVSALLAGLLPAWRGCQITPAIQLKSH